MAVGVRAGEGPLALDGAAREELRANVVRALRTGDGGIASVTLAVDPGIDFSALVLANRDRAGDAFCFEQPDRDGFVLAGTGTCAGITPDAGDRFASAARGVRHYAGTIAASDPASDADAPPGSGPVWVGGFSFAARGGPTPEWSDFAHGGLALPGVSFARQAGAARMTLNVMLAGDEDPDEVVERLTVRAADLRPASMPLLDPDPVEAARVASAAPPEHFEAAIARATERIAAGELEKVVLAREVRVHAPRAIDTAAVYGALREAFPSCYCYLVDRFESTFLGASPELLVRRDGQRAQTVALAGTLRRSADPAVDRHLAEQLLNGPRFREEQAIVTRRIERALDPVSVWVAAADEPVVVKVQNVQHLGTPIRAQLAEPISAIELAGLLHPTPAVGGEPAERALPLIPALEGLDRGWYAGPLGWTDLAEDGEFCVALRCALIRDRVAHLYAGEGIVRDSDPAEELAANEAKLQALLPLLT